MEESKKNNELAETVRALNLSTEIFYLHQGDAFDELMSNGIRPVADAMRLDRVSVYRFKDADKGKRPIMTYLWDRSKGGTTAIEEKTAALPRNQVTANWIDILSKGGCINKRVCDMSKEESAFLSSFGIKVIFVSPVFLRGEFWGAVTLQDHTSDEYFADSSTEADLLQSATHIFSNAIIRADMMRSIEAALLEANKTLDIMTSILNKSNAMIYVTDLDTDAILFMNDYTKEHFGIEGDVTGQPCYKVIQSGIDQRCDFCPCYQLDKEPDKTIIWEEHNTLTKRYYRNTDRYVDWPGGKKVHIQHCVDITDIRQAQEALGAALKQATIASKAKGDFLSVMSHEMRTPMNAIIGMTAIGKKAQDIEQKNHALNKIGDAASHLFGVINDVLDMAKIEADKLELSSIEYNFKKMLQKVITVINFRIDEKQQTLSVNIDNNIPCFIVGDDQRLAQVITNLLSNAVKFTPEGGKIHLGASFIGETDGNCELRIEVADSGIGISTEQQKRLFLAFEQAESGTSREYGGTGLGLVISKRIVELMDGRIWIESEFGKGARFIFTIRALRGMESDGNTDKCVKNNAEGSGENDVFTGKRMLLAEDIEINREILIALLEGSGLIIDCAENGKEALDMVEAAPDKYDVIFMDVQMPKMDGMEATRRIRAFPALQNVRLPIIAMTANVFKDDIEACFAAGMDDHLGKPLDIDKVMEKLRKYLKINEPLA